MSALLDLPAGTVYVPLLAGGTTLPVRPTKAVKVQRCRFTAPHDCHRPWFVVTSAGPRSFQSFEDALLDGKA